MSIELCYLSATEAIKKFKAQELSPVDLMRAIIARAEQVEPLINAFSYTYFEEALAQAKSAEIRYANGTARPLEGIPFAVKDESEVKGYPTSNGSLLMKDYIAENDTTCVRRALDAGAIMHARTTTPEFSVAVTTWSRLWGVTRNPWNLDMTPGGSTGGGGAALAAGTTTLINGTDIGGSIRVPAALNGLIGYKPPYGRNPEDPPWNLETYTHIGPLARTVRDCILLQNVMCGPSPDDIASLKPKLVLPSEYASIEGMRIGYSADLGYQPVSAEVRTHLHTALDTFRALGAIVEPVELDWTFEALDATTNKLTYTLTGAGLREAYDAHKELLTPYARWFAEQTTRVTQQDFIRAETLAGEMYSSLTRNVFANYDLLICPTTACAGVAADFDYSQDTIEIDGKQVDAKFGWVMTYPFNMLSRCPVLTIPAGRAANNVPIGLQLVAPTYEDETVFRAAMAYEKAFSAENSPFISLLNYPFL